MGDEGVFVLGEEKAGGGDRGEDVFEFVVGDGRVLALGDEGGRELGGKEGKRKRKKRERK